MSELGHNGGPPITEADVPDLTYVKFYPADFLTGTAHLNLEMRGAYITALCIMYDRMSGFPYDECEGARLLRVDRRVYRRVRDDLLADGKFYRDGALIRNRRVDDEIRSYVTEYIRRSNAAREREARRRQAATSAELRPNLSRTSAGSSPEVQTKFDELEAKNPIKTTEIEPQTDHIPESRSQNLESRSKKEKEGALQPLASDEAPSSPTPTDALEAFRGYNELAQRIGLPIARTLTPRQRKSLVARLREHGGLAAWAIVLANVERSAFLRGRNPRGWRVDLDFLLQPSRLTKVINGSYGNGAHGDVLAPQETYLERISRLVGEAEDHLDRKAIP